MREIEAFVKPKKKKKAGANNEDEDIYDLCDQMLSDLKYLDQQLENRESASSQLQK